MMYRLSGLPYQKIFAFAVCAQLFALLFDLACPVSFYLPEITTAVLTVIILGRVLMRKDTLYFSFQNRIVVFLLTALLGYLVLDVLSFLRSGFAVFWVKYRVAGVSMINAVGIMMAVRKRALTGKNILAVIYLAGIAAGILGAVTGLGLKTGEISYTNRITLRNDYNMYATVLFSAGCSGLGVYLTGKKNTGSQLLFWLSEAFLWCMIYLSGSRRMVMALLPAAILFVAAVMKEHRNDWKKKAVAAAAVLLLTAVSSAAVNGWITREESNKSSSETTLPQRYETVKGAEKIAEEQGALKTRRVLWGAAWDELRYRLFSSPAEFLFGMGGGYDIELYDRLLREKKDERFNRIFAEEEKYQGKLSAHNFLLADGLNGGVTKAAAAVIFWGVAIVAAGRAVRKNWQEGLSAAMLLGVVFVNNMISNRYGFLYDKYFYLVILLLVVLLEGEIQRNDAKRNGNMHSDFGASMG